MQKVFYGKKVLGASGQSVMQYDCTSMDAVRQMREYLAVVPTHDEPHVVHSVLKNGQLVGSWLFVNGRWC